MQIRHGVAAAIISLLPTIAKAEDAKKPDSGKFNMTIQGMKAGNTTFKFDADGGCDADIAIDIGGQNTKVKLAVKAKAGKFNNVAATAGPANKFTAAIEGAKAKLSINGDA